MQQSSHWLEWDAPHVSQKLPFPSTITNPI